MAMHRPSSAWSFHTDTSYLAISQVLPPDATQAGDHFAVDLPPPRGLGDVSLAAAIGRRVSCRRFSGGSLTLEEVSALLDAAYGGQGDQNGAWIDNDLAPRPVPSAGARYPLELHLIVWSVAGLEPCTYRYLPSPHRLVPTGGLVSAEAVGNLFLGQGYLTAASALVVMAATLGPSLARYGDRGYRYVLFEAGHVAQNLDLACSALRLGSLNLGGFWDQPLGWVLRITEQVPLYAFALGRSSTTDRQELQQPVGGWP